MANRDPPGFAIIGPVVDGVDGHAFENRRRVGEVQSALLQRAVALGRIEGDDHTINVCTINEWSNRGFLGSFSPRGAAGAGLAARGLAGP